MWVVEMRWLCILTVLVPSAAAVAAPPTPSKVTVETSSSGAQLRVDGAPFVIRGAGGDAPMHLLKKAGGNATRTWGVGADTPGRLADAERHGLKVVLGIWLGHPRHGFDYANRDQVRRQFAEARRAVLLFRDHPALLAWGVGNEMEGFAEGDDPKVWRAVNDIAAMIKTLDPHHPTLTVTAEIGGARVKAVHRWCPAIDIMGINSYGGVRSLPERYRAAGGTKPYVVTEYGPPGSWEQPMNAWGVPQEKTSTEKAAFYRAGYEALAADPLCLGSFAFLWGHKQEGTSTWFGLFLPDLTQLAGVDALTEAWSGRPPEHRSPRIRRLWIDGSPTVSPGGRIVARLDVEDPDNDHFVVQWVLSREMATFNTGGDVAPTPMRYRKAVVEADRAHAVLRMPPRPGYYRLYVYVRDSRGGAATANVPVRVAGEVPKGVGGYVELPLIVYGDDRVGRAFAPSGYMGAHQGVSMDPKSRTEPRAGPTCLEVTFRNARDWAGVVWQDPPNDWGDKAGGAALHGATRLSFWARGAQGGERVKFGYGLLKDDKPYPDSAGDERTIRLSSDWKQYTFDLQGKDLGRIKSGFYWAAAGQGEQLRFYLDDIRYER